MSKERLGTIVTLISASSFATLAIFAKFAYGGGAGVLSVLLWRFLGAFLIFGFYLYIKKEPFFYERSTALKLLSMGALGYSSMSALFLLSASRIPASLSVMLLYLYPAFVTICTVLLKQEIYSAQKGYALVITMLGLVFVLGNSFGNIDPLGIFCGLGASVVYTAYIVMGSRLIRSLDPIKSTFHIMLGSTCAFALAGLLTGNVTARLTPKVWLAIAAIILVSTVCAVLFFWMGVKLVGASKASIISTVEPPVTVLLAWLILGERLTPIQLLGGILILAGVVILQYPFGKAADNVVESN